MGANPLLGFGRVYARPEVARTVDAAVRRLLNDPQRRFVDFYEGLRRRGLTVWGAAVDTLENTSRFAEGRTTGPMTVLHLFDVPLTVTRPYESYFGCLTVPRSVTDTAERRSVLLDWRTPRATVIELIEATYPGIRREHVHVWTLAGRTRAPRIGALWKEWQELGAHLVEEGWRTPAGIPAFTDSGTYAPTFLVRSWQDAAGATHVFLCDGYAATAEAMQAASLSHVLDVDATMAVLSSTFRLPHDDEYRLMKLTPEAPDFASSMAAILHGQEVTAERIEELRTSIRDAEQANVPLRQRVLRADDFMPEKRWGVLASAGYICDDPYTGAPGVERLDDDRYRVTTLLATRDARARITFTFRLKEGREAARLIFSPLLVRAMSGVDWRQRAVKISDSGRIRNELQTLISQAVEHDGERLRVHFDRIDDKVVPPDKQRVIREVLQWYKENHPVWFGWLEIAG